MLLLVAVSASWATAADTEAHCNQDRYYYIQGELEEEWIGEDYCDLQDEHIALYTQLCKEYCGHGRRGLDDCDFDANRDSFEDIFNASIDGPKWVTHQEEKIVTYDRDDRCVSKYLCECIGWGDTAAQSGSF